MEQEGWPSCRCDSPYPAEDAGPSPSSAGAPCKFNNVLKSWSHINRNVFPTLRLQLSGGGFQKSFRELFDRLSRRLIGKSDSEARTKEEKEELGGDGEEEEGRKGGPRWGRSRHRQHDDCLALAAPPVTCSAAPGPF